MKLTKKEGYSLNRNASGCSLTGSKLLMSLCTPPARKFGFLNELMNYRRS
jgi:hypothetical protein